MSLEIIAGYIQPLIRLIPKRSELYDPGPVQLLGGRGHLWFVLYSCFLVVVLKVHCT